MSGTSTAKAKPYTVVSPLPSAQITSATTAFSSDDTAVAVTVSGKRFRVRVSLQPTATKTMQARLAYTTGTVSAALTRAIVEGDSAIYTSLSAPTLTSPIVAGTSGAHGTDPTLVGGGQVGIYEWDLTFSASVSVTFTPSYAASVAGSAVYWRRMEVTVLE